MAFLRRNSLYRLPVCKCSYLLLRLLLELALSPKGHLSLRLSFNFNRKTPRMRDIASASASPDPSEVVFPLDPLPAYPPFSRFDPSPALTLYLLAFRTSPWSVDLLGSAPSCPLYDVSYRTSSPKVFPQSPRCLPGGI